MLHGGKFLAASSSIPFHRLAARQADAARAPPPPPGGGALQVCLKGFGSPGVLRVLHPSRPAVDRCGTPRADEVPLAASPDQMKWAPRTGRASARALEVRSSAVLETRPNCRFGASRPTPGVGELSRYALRGLKSGRGSCT